MPADSPIKKEFVSNSPLETEAIGKRIADAVCASWFTDTKKKCENFVIALCGTLGSGKTYLTKVIASKLGLTENLTSPTYNIINEYSFHKKINEQTQIIKFFHIDVYRLEGDKDFEEIGGIDILNSNESLTKTLCIIEWSDRIPNSLPPDTITISIEITGDTTRIFRVIGLDNL